MLDVQPTPLPWSARQSHMWSPITLLLLTTRLWAALPTPAPPIRKNTSLSEVGFAAWFAVEPAGPTCIRTDELVVPASMSSPATLTPSTSATETAVTPLSGISVARPRPSTTVSGRVTRMVSERWKTPGVKSRFLPAASAALMVAAESPGLAMKNCEMGSEDPAAPPAQLVPEVFVRRAGTKTW